jgi:DUF4097 and DUF4098 domain-containing protein YvlB
MVTKASPELLVRLTTLPIILVIGAMSVSAAQKDLEQTDRFPAAEGKIVEVDAADLDLRVRAADVDFIEANTLLHIGGTGDDKGQRWIDNHTPVFTDGDERLQIVVEPGKSGFLGFGSLSAKARLALLVPGRIIPDLTTTSGNIQARGDYLNARPLRLRTSSGNIEFVGAAISLEVRSAGGDAQIEVIRPLESFFALTSSGEVRLVGGTREARVDTASGAIRLENLSGGVEVSTSNGKITLIWDRLDADQNVRVRSSSGRVQLVVPGDASPQGTLRTTTGSIRSELPGEVTADGTTLVLQGNGPTFDVETASGEIQLTIGESWD